MVKYAVSLVTIASLVVSPSSLVLARQTAAPAKPAATTPAAAVVEEPPLDGGWPRAYLTPAGAQLLLYQPQISSWTDQSRMTAYLAASYQGKGAKQPSLGTIQIESQTSVAVTERLVSFSQYTIKQAHFATVPKDQLRTVIDDIQKAVPGRERVIGLDRVLASIDSSQIVPRNVPGVKADPPAIFFNTRASALVNIDGEPVWSPIDKNDLRFAVNTNWDLFEHGPTKTYYLRVEQSWMSATALDGPWTANPKLPESFTKLPADANWKEVKSAVPGKNLSPADVPNVFVSMTPAELILIDGEPEYEPVAGTKLQWVANTESDVFRIGTTGTIYYLVSGRWFSAARLAGPWTFASLKLPDDFKRIPLEHPRSRVLASVPGTPQAVDAVLLAQIPQTARVSKKTPAPDVAYQGPPKFVPEPNTKVERAVNTDKDIIKVGDMYYMCFQGVWFMGKSPTGPWEVASSVPGEIYEIPISSPAHNVTYVKVEEDDDDDDAVVFVAAAAYMGMMVAWGCTVWGSGWYYPPYYHYGYGYPGYYPRYPTYGYGASYNPWTGAYTRGAVAYGPYGGAGMASRYNPRTGTYSRGAAAWGPYGASGVAQAYNPRTGTYAGTRQGSNAYGSWGSTNVQRGDQWAQTARVTNNRTGTTTRVTQGSGGGTSVSRSGAGGRTTIGQSGSGDMYAGHDGNVYRKNDAGGWQKYENGGWNDMAGATPQQRDAARDAAGAQARDRAASGGASSSTVGQLDRDSSARTQGNDRTREAGYSRQGSGSNSTYRPSSGSRSSGGGMRSRPSGGGRRR